MKQIEFDVVLRSTQHPHIYPAGSIYTNDYDSVQLIFNLTDFSSSELTGATAKIYLYMSNGSFYQETAVIGAERIVYNLTGNQTKHFGQSKVQIDLTAGGRTYASPIFLYTINEGLETQVPREVLIEDWQTLTDEAMSWLDGIGVDEASRKTAESGRVTNESARVSAETGRVNAETARATVESNRTAAESSRVTAETGRAGAESSRVTVEANRVAKESARVSAETGRVNAETARATAESNRASKETARATAETGRTDAETSRVTAETNRATVEGARVTAESNRASKETARATAETGRTDAETSRVAAETGRVNAETARVQAETLRDSYDADEALRKSAETDRVTKETARVTAETGRAGAETDRVSAENLRKISENSRLTAESGRVGAEDVRASAEVSRSGAEIARLTKESERDAAEAIRVANEIERLSTSGPIVREGSVLDNIIPASVMSTASAWDTSSASMSLSNNVMTLVGNGQSQNINFSLKQSAMPNYEAKMKQGHVYAIGATAEFLGDKPYQLSLRFLSASGSGYRIPDHEGKLLLIALMSPGPYEVHDLSFGVRYEDRIGQGRSTVEITYPFVVDLTETFGEGMEPTLDEAKGLLSSMAPFYGPRELTQKQESEIIRSQLNTKVNIGNGLIVENIIPSDNLDPSKNFWINNHSTKSFSQNKMTLVGDGQSNTIELLLDTSKLEGGYYSFDYSQYVIGATIGFVGPKPSLSMRTSLIEDYEYEDIFYASTGKRMQLSRGISYEGETILYEFVYGSAYEQGQASIEITHPFAINISKPFSDPIGFVDYLHTDPSPYEIDFLIEDLGNFYGSIELSQRQVTNYLNNRIHEKASVIQPEWYDPTLLNGSSSVPGMSFQIMRDTLGFVHLRGQVDVSTDDIITILPYGFQPERYTEIAVDDGIGSTSRIMILTNGEVYKYGSENKVLNLDGTYFFGGNLL